MLGYNIKFDDFWLRDKLEVLSYQHIINEQKFPARDETKRFKFENEFFFSSLVNAGLAHTWRLQCDPSC